jgi:hypothetical protein
MMSKKRRQYKKKKAKFIRDICLVVCIGKIFLASVLDSNIVFIT